MEKSNMGKKNVLVLFANGTEELEAIAACDSLKRAGANVVTAKVFEKDEQDKENLTVNCMKGIKVTCDKKFTDAMDCDWDLVILPGGNGAKVFNRCEKTVEFVTKHKHNNKLLGAICGAPVDFLFPNGLLKGEKVTCYPTKLDQIPENERCDQKVCVSNNLITSQGPGTALEFGLKCVEMLYDENKSMDVAKEMCAEHVCSST